MKVKDLLELKNNLDIQYIQVGDTLENLSVVDCNKEEVIASLSKKYGEETVQAVNVNRKEYGYAVEITFQIVI